MARIRTIKPEFFTSETVLELEPLARLFFIGLWCEADRDGVLKWKPKTLKMRYLPADDLNIESIADQLIEQECIKIYEVDGNEYCLIPEFLTHQVVNNREKASGLPNIGDATSTRESGVSVEGREGRKGKEGKGRERKGKEVSSKTPEWNKKMFSDELKNLGADDRSVADWMKTRTTFTETAFNGTIKQIEKSGLTVAQAVELCAESGWKGFKADYVQGRQVAPNQKQANQYNKYNPDPNQPKVIEGELL